MPVLGGLLVLAFTWPLLLAAGNAYAAKRGLEQALETMAAGNVDEASQLAHLAREDLRDIDRTTDGFSGFVWGLLPGGEADMADVRELSTAAVDVTDVVIIASDAYPEELSGRGFLLGPDNAIDIEALESVLGVYDEMLAQVQAAADANDRVEARSPLLGPMLRTTSSQLGQRLQQGLDGMRAFRPLVPVLPRLLGGDGEQRLLVALLNPSEQRFSGGATLSFATLTLDDGELSQDDTVIGAEDQKTFARFSWPPVRDNPFHQPGTRLRLSTATLAPSWSVSGEELLRAWDERGETRTDGLVAVDVVALQALMRFTGPITVSGYGTLTADNLTQQLVGSYEAYTTPEAFLARRAGGAQLMAEFQRRIISGSGLVGKVDSILSSAAARRFMVYHRDPAAMRAFDRMGLSGDLSDTPHDYVGVFNQALAGQKSDYWQRRDVRQRVTLQPGGDAKVQLQIRIHNDAPPPAEDVFPGYAQYVRRDNDMALATFLPVGVDNVVGEVDGEPAEVDLAEFRGRPFAKFLLDFAPQQSRRVTLTYDVPDAARPLPRGLRYQLDVDPQSLVDPEAFEVVVRWPEGLAPRSLPEGWSAEPGRARFETADLAFSPRWRITLSRR